MQSQMWSIEQLYIKLGSILNFMFMLLPFHEIIMHHSYYNNLKIKAVVGKQECYLKNNVIPLDFEVVRRQKNFFGVE